MARHSARRRQAALIAPVFAVLVCVFANLAAADKPAIWIELRTPHFTVYSDGGEKTARAIAVQFEEMRNTFLKILDNGRVDPGQPIIILAAKDEKSMAALLPEYYKEKGRVHPAGLYGAGPEEIYISVQADAGGDLPFQVVYHEYTHQLLHLNLAVIPTWLDEGYAEFFGNSEISGRTVTIGYAPRWQMQALQQMTMMPLEQLFRVDHKSPYYNEANHANVFYQKSWALAHLLFFDPTYKKADALGNYLKLVNNGVDPVEAGRQTFGDLDALMHHLETYIGAAGYYSGSVNSPIDEFNKTFTTRSLTEGEADGLLGSYILARGQTDDARPLLEQAAKLDPNSAAANEGLGMLHQRLNEQDEAATYFARAVELNSGSFLPYYFDALHKERQGPSEEGAAEVSLKKAITLNPNFAPARANLAQLDLKHPEKLDEALGAARAAVALEPAQWQNLVILAQVMAARKEIDQARAIANRIAVSQKDPSAQAAVTALLDYLKRLEEYNQQLQARQAAPQLELPPTSLDDSSGPPRLRERADRSGASAGKSDSVSVVPPPDSGATLPASSSPTRLYSMDGTVGSIDCTKNPEVSLTLTSGSLSMKLHASDLSHVRFFGPDGDPQGRALTCAQLQNSPVRMIYQLLSGGPYDGEIAAIKPGLQ